MILGIYGKSKSGKTTLVEKLTKDLVEKGYKVGSVKNIHVEDFSIDTEGKDTWKHSQAGAELVVARSEDETAFIVKKGLTPNHVVDIILEIADLDIVIVEGFWDDDSPKIIVGDAEERPNTVFRYENNYPEILKLAVEGIEVDRVLKKLQDLDCGKCGFETCRELAQSIYVDEKRFDDCYYYSEKRVSLEVNGKEIPLGKFAKEIVAGTIAGMIGSLKGVEEGKEIKIEIIG